MKKNIFSSFFIIIALFISSYSFPVYADSSNNNSTDYSIEYFDDGSYMIITINEDVNNSRATVKSGSKTTTYKNSSGETQWTYKITGTFSYTGSSSSCTSVSDSYTISNDNWHMSSHSCSKSGNTAYGTVTMKYKILGITTNTISKDLSLTCSATGTLS